MLQNSISTKNNILDAFRIIATLQVFFGHIITHFGITSANVYNIVCFVRGVPILFVLCGFLAAMSIGNKSVKDWYFSRAVRILPAFWACIIINSIIIFVLYALPSFKDGILYGATQMLGLNFYTGDWLRDYGVGTPNGVLWTIPVQIEFFILVPILNKILKDRSLKFGLIMVGAFALVSILVHRLYGVLPEIILKLVEVTVLPYLYFLVLGMVGWYHKDKLIVWCRKYKWWLLAGYVIWKLLEINFSFPHVLDGVLYNTVTTALIGLVIFAFAFTFNWRAPMDITYGFYLYHMVFINIAIEFFKELTLSNIVVSTIILFVLSILAAIISQKLIEVPVASKLLKKKN